MRRHERRMRDRVVRIVRPPRRPIIYVGPRDRLYKGRGRNALYAIFIIFLLVFFISFLIMCFYMF